MTMARLVIFLLGSVYFHGVLLAADANSGRPLPFDTVLTNARDKPFKEGGKDFTLGDAAINALDATFEVDKTTAGKVKQERDDLARKIFHDPKVLLTTEEIALIKDRIGIAYGSDIVGPAWRLIESGTQ